MNNNSRIHGSLLIGRLNTYLNEDEILGSIHALSDEIKRIESTTGPSKRTDKMRREVGFLQDKLSYSRDQGSLMTAKYHREQGRTG